MKHWKMKNEKVLLNIQTKWTDIANEILNAAIDAEQTFKCKWPKAWFFRLSTFTWNKVISIIVKVLFGVIKFLISVKMVVLSATGIDSLNNLLLTLWSKHVFHLLALVRTEFYTDHHISKLRILYYKVYKTN